MTITTRPAATTCPAWCATDHTVQPGDIVSHEDQPTTVWDAPNSVGSMPATARVSLSWLGDEPHPFVMVDGGSLLLDANGTREFIAALTTRLTLLEQTAAAR